MHAAREIHNAAKLAVPHFRPDAGTGARSSLYSRLALTSLSRRTKMPPSQRLKYGRRRSVYADRSTVRFRLGSPSPELHRTPLGGGARGEDAAPLLGDHSSVRHQLLQHTVRAHQVLDHLL